MGKSHYRRGDIYFADLGDGFGSEQKGCRPVVIIQNDIGNKYSPTVIIAAISSKHISRNKVIVEFRYTRTRRKDKRN